MKLRIAILAACASTLVLAQADVARANYGAAFESTSAVRITHVGLETIKLAQNAPTKTKSSNTNLPGKKVAPVGPKKTQPGIISTTRDNHRHLDTKGHGNNPKANA
jgi:hypothetical protein